MKSNAYVVSRQFAHLLLRTHTPLNDYAFKRFDFALYTDSYGLYSVWKQKYRNRNYKIENIKNVKK